MNNLIIGRNPVMEALKSGREIEKILIANGAEGSVKKIEGIARDRGIPVQRLGKPALDRLTDGVHQGVIAYGSVYQYKEVADLLWLAREKGEDPFLVILDGVEDPHNLGAIIRSADGAGAHGVIIPKRRSVPVNETVVKASAGAVEYLGVSRVTNLSQVIEALKSAGLWIYACDMDGRDYGQVDLTGPAALIIGGEGRGVSRILREKCDYILSIPMEGGVNSLNASNAAAVLLYDVNRQRRMKRNNKEIGQSGEDG